MIGQKMGTVQPKVLLQGSRISANVPKVKDIQTLQTSFDDLHGTQRQQIEMTGRKVNFNTISVHEKPPKAAVNTSFVPSAAITTPQQPNSPTQRVVAYELQAKYVKGEQASTPELMSAMSINRISQLDKIFNSQLPYENIGDIENENDKSGELYNISIINPETQDKPELKLRVIEPLEMISEYIAKTPVENSRVRQIYS